ncbi:MAG: DUF885 domain-containing protein [Pseudomonadota bacterium]
MRTIHRTRLLFIAFCGFALNAMASDNWVETSNANAQIVLKAMAKYSPEGAGSLGVDGLDEDISVWDKGIYKRSLADFDETLKALNKKLDDETHPTVRQDLQILIKAIEDSLTSTKLDRDNMLPYYNVSSTVFSGIRGLIDPQIPAERYPAAIVRLKKYAGIERGYTPIVEHAIARTKERFKVKGLVGPYKGEVEQDLERSATFITGIKELFEGTELTGWEEAYETLAKQLNDYNDWVRAEMLPRAREDYRLPNVMYRDALKNWGVDADPEELIKRATAGYMDIRNEMEALAPLVAQEKGYETKDYREVIRLLKEDRVTGDALLPFYRDVLGELEDIIRAERLVSLPEREAGIRIATAAETARQPAAHLDVPRLIGNTGEYPTFVIPLLEQNEDGTWPESDDTYKAGAWTLTAHEARPGHELQFSSMIEGGVSITRGVFAFNSANVEGWALYAEAIAKPYMPLDAQMISLQYRLARAARMYLDPMLNLGRITPEEAKRILKEDVVLGETWAQNEIERYTYRIPGQATAYYYGYLNLQALRTQTEIAMGEAFDAQAFHDFILAQGLLPPDILAQAIREKFVQM